MSFASLLLEPELPAEPDTPAVIVARPEGDHVTGYFDLVAGTQRLATTLVEAGVAPRTAVACLLPPSAGVVAAFFGTWAAGGVYVPINPRLSDTEIAHQLAEVHPAAVIGQPEQLERVAAPITRITAENETCPPKPDAPPTPITRIAEEKDLNWSVAQRDATAATLYPPGVATVSFTSGTTGRPKPVELHENAVLRLMDTIIATARRGRPITQRPETPHVIPVSTSLWAGIYNVVFAVRTASPVLLMPSFDALEYARVVGHYRVASTVLPPAAIAMLNEEPDIHSLDPLRIVRSITAPLSPLQVRRFHQRFGVMVLNGYGQTELGGEIVGWTTRDFREHPEKLGAVGRPYSGVELRLGQQGELWARTAYTTGLDPRGQFGDRLDENGFFRTGDIARLDEDGFLWIEGRESDMINRGGLKVFPAEVEEVLLLSESVADAAVVGVPDPRLGETPWAFVVPATTSPSLSRDDLEQLCRRHLAPYKAPVAFKILDSLPRNEIGKVLRRVLVDQAVAAQR